MNNQSMQVLLSMVKKQINELQNDVNVCENCAAYYYERSDKDQAVDTESEFYLLNKYRDKIRIGKKSLKSLAVVAKDLKKSLRN